MQKIPNKKNLKFHYSPLRYPGGKTFLFPFFDSVIKKSGLDKVTYVEPFAGGAGAALALLFLEKVDQIVINDYDKAIYSFWKSAIFNSEKFIEKIKIISNNIENPINNLGFILSKKLKIKTGIDIIKINIINQYPNGS